MSDQLYQINIAHINDEDRLLMRATTKNGDEYRVWFTRRYAGILMDILNKSINERGGITTLGSSPQTSKMLKGGALEQPFKPDVKNYPLGEKGMLAFGIKTNVGKDKILNLQLLPENGQGMTLNLNDSLLYMFHNLLSQGIARADWNIRQNQVAGGPGNIH
ncbi:MAG: hypothetical protein O7D86_00015 [Proteobacteria bacterium]|nr:hypothetical protein [Pseudomonadota bacterium]